MKRILAIAFLTLKSAFRFRLVQVLGVLLFGAVVALPLIIKDDGTARGFTQILLTYTLTVITALLGFSTLWLGCGTLAREVEECQMQMVVVKPIARWQVWLGKWLGLMMVNAVLLSLSGAAVYGLMMWRASKLPPAQQEALRKEILVARGSAREKLPDIEPLVEEAFRERLKNAPAPITDQQFLRNQIREQAKAEFQIVQPGFLRRWDVDLGVNRHQLRDKPLFLRVKFSTSDEMDTISAPKTYPTLWQVGVPDTARIWRASMTLAANTFHEFEIPPNLFSDEGRLIVECLNPSNAAFLFQMEDGLEVLYPESGFGFNYFRGLIIIFCWLSLMAALGLASASFLSFPVAALVSLVVLFLGLSTGTLTQVVEEGGIAGVNPETGRVDNPGIGNQVAVLIFGSLLKVINLVQGFSPIENLSTGRSISWGQLALAIFQVVIVLGGVFSLIGIVLFTRRELAAAQSNV